MQVLQSSLYVLRYIKLPLDKTVRGTEERIPAQVTKGLVNWNFVPLMPSKNVHPAQAEAERRGRCSRVQPHSATTTAS